MFISKSELQKIHSQIEFLQDLACKFQSDLIALKVHQERSGVPTKTGMKHKNSRSAESRARQSQIMKAYWAAKKEKKAAE